MTKTWAKAAAIHLAVVGLSFVLSLIVLRSIDPFPGQVIDAMVFAVLVTHAGGAIVGLLIPRASKVSCALVFVVAFLAAAFVGVVAIHDAIYLRYYAAYDRFQDHLVSPVPQSVSNLRFVPLEQSIRPDLIFQFDIDPGDMNANLKRLHLGRVDPDKMLNPKDFFQYPYYVPLASEYELFQGRDRYGNVLTIKTNAAHSHGVFRLESSRFYEERRWVKRLPIQAEMENTALVRMRRDYTVGH